MGESPLVTAPHALVFTFRLGRWVYFSNGGSRYLRVVMIGVQPRVAFQIHASSWNVSLFGALSLQARRIEFSCYSLAFEQTGDLRKFWTGFSAALVRSLTRLGVQSWVSALWELCTLVGAREMCFGLACCRRARSGAGPEWPFKTA